MFYFPTLREREKNAEKKSRRDIQLPVIGVYFPDEQKSHTGICKGN